MHYIAGDLKKTHSYKYDMRGNQVEKDENGIITKYHYDPLGRLKAAELPSGRLQDYEYDDFGNRTKLVEAEGNIIKETSYEYGIDSRLLFSETKVDDDLTQERFEYDPEGNLLKSLECFKYKGNLTAEKAISYHYDGYNQLSMVEGPDANIYEYTYDSNGLRTRKTFGDEAINYINEGGNIILETNKDMKITARNIRGSRLIYRETDLTYYGYIHNGHGDIIGLTDDKGNIIKDYTYDPFGKDDENHVKGFGNNRSVEIWRNEVEKIDNPFRYCGEYQDVETRNIYLRARYYSPEIARFISEDSYEGDVKNPLSLNLYTYVQGNPLKYVDPDGHNLLMAMGYFVGAYNNYQETGDFEEASKTGADTALTIATIELSVYDVALALKGIADGVKLSRELSKGAGKGPYSYLEDPASIGSGKDFTAVQKNKIIEENMQRNSGVIKSDLSGQELVKPSKSQKGVTPPENE